MRYLLAGCLLLAACGAPEAPTDVALGTAAQSVQPGKNPLCVTWGMTGTDVRAVAGPPDRVGTAAGDAPIEYSGATYWEYDGLACGTWFVWFKAGVVISRFGYAHGCEAAPDSACGR